VSTNLGVHPNNRCKRCKVCKDSKLHVYVRTYIYVHSYGLCHFPSHQATPLLHELERASSRRLESRKKTIRLSIPHLNPTFPTTHCTIHWTKSATKRQCSPRPSTRKRKHQHTTNANSCPRFRRHCRPAAPMSTEMVAHTPSNRFS
jgi:hypothetical protein